MRIIIDSKRQAVLFLIEISFVFSTSLQPDGTLDCLACLVFREIVALGQV